MFRWILLSWGEGRPGYEENLRVELREALTVLQFLQNQKTGEGFTMVGELRRMAQPSVGSIGLRSNLLGQLV